VQNVRDKGYLTVVEGEVPDAVDLPRGAGSMPAAIA